ncbi:MAG: SsrA-binding protein SmpB [Patescibacteria group bacterium]
MDLSRNKKAFFDYKHLETFDAGIVLSGAEVKATKMGLVNLQGSFVTIKNGQVILKGCRIARYPKSGADQEHYQPDHDRMLLLTKKEIARLVGSLSARGLTIVPLSVYSSHRLVKVKIALARGKRKFDKREAIKEKEYKRRLNSRVR